MPSDSIPPLSSAQDVVKAALLMLDSALAYATNPAAAGTGGFPLPATWLGGNAYSATQFARLIRSHRARFRAGVARTAVQRNAVDWQKIIEDTEGGIQEDFLVSVGGSTGWSIGDLSQIYVDPGWGQISLMYFGMAPRPPRHFVGGNSRLSWPACLATRCDLCRHQSLAGGGTWWRFEFVFYQRR